MAAQTDIQWCDSTGNIQMGCEGCELVKGKNKNNPKCYAKVMTDRYGGKNIGFPAVFEHPKLFLHRLPKIINWPDLTGKDRPDKPWLNGMPRVVFLNDMGDTFSNGMPEEWFADIMPTLAQSPHIYLVLTKWPNRFAKFSQKYPLPVNVCPGTSITSNKTTFRCNELMKVVGGGFKWLSIEPLWEKLDMNGLEKVDWMIFGGESGGNAAPCDMYWIIDGLDYCLEFAIPAFMKQMGSNPQWKGKPVPWAFKDYHGGDPDEWPKGMRVRQFPSWYVNQYIL